MDSASNNQQCDDLASSQVHRFPLPFSRWWHRAGSALHLRSTLRGLATRFYYLVKPVIPKRYRLYLRRKSVSSKIKVHFTIWPIDARANCPPQRWQGWPEGRRFCLVLTHDVEGIRGVERSYRLASWEKDQGFRASFNFVAEGYPQDRSLHQYLSDIGFEIGLHGLVHTENLFKSKSFFWNQLPRINAHLRDWKAVGFRTPSMYHNLELIQHIELEYDASTFDTDPFEPQPDGIRTIYPVWVQSSSSSRGFVELPYTLAQDFTLFVLMGEKGIDTWKRKLDWIAECGGMALMNTHPDYMSFNGQKPDLDEYPADYYEQFLLYVKKQYEGHYWHVLPRDLARFWSRTYGNGNQAIRVDHSLG